MNHYRKERIKTALIYPRETFANEQHVPLRLGIPKRVSYSYPKDFFRNEDQLSIENRKTHLNEKVSFPKLVLTRKFHPVVQLP